VWPLNVGQVYTTLQRLERDGLVASEGSDDGPQKGYRLTDDGHDELLSWLQTPPDDGQPPRDELLIKVLVAVQVPLVDVGDVIQVHRRHLVELMQRYTAVKADADADDVALALVVDAELFRIEGAIRWLDSAEVRLRQQPRPVVPVPPVAPEAPLPGKAPVAPEAPPTAATGRRARTAAGAGQRGGRNEGGRS
jgi:DNA-binding PadR family transcriptional regulator